MFATGVIALSLSWAVANAYMPNYIVTTRQNASNIGFIETIDGETGSVVNTNDISFEFQWPYVQMTTDTKHNNVYTLTIPTDNIPRIYQLSSSVAQLKETGYWTILDGTVIFDLQYAVPKDTIFGIKVTGTYQRTLSNIDLRDDNEIVISELYNLPENWFVNASSYSQSDDMYYALINNFPGHEWSTLEQQLLMVNFSSCVVAQSTPKPDGVLVPIMKNDAFDGQVQFIAFHETASAKRVFAWGINLQSNVATLVLLDTVTGEPINLGFHRSGVSEVGPLVMHSNHGTTEINMSLMVKYSGQWFLYYVTYNTNSGAISHFFNEKAYNGDDYKYFAAATVAFEEY